MRRWFLSILSVTFIAGAVLSWGETPKPLESEDELRAIDRAHEAAESVRKNFRSALSTALGKGPAEKALAECRVHAPAAVNGAATDGIRVGRTSQRLRNPKNAPPEWTKSYLDKFSSAKPSEIPKHVLVKLDNHRYGYLEPIFVEPICLNCHGTAVDKLVHSAIRMEYPQDRAVGYRKGDFRGLLWLEMKKE